MKFLKEARSGTPITINKVDGSTYFFFPTCTAQVQSKQAYEGGYFPLPDWSTVESFTYDLTKHPDYKEETWKHPWWIELGIELGILDVKNHPEVRNNQFTWKKPEGGGMPDDWCHNLIQIMWLRMPMAGPGVLEKYQELRKNPEFDCVDDFNLLRMCGAVSSSFQNDGGHTLFPYQSFFRPVKNTVEIVKGNLRNGLIITTITGSNGPFRLVNAVQIGDLNYSIDDKLNVMLNKWKEVNETETLCS